ncbi:oxidoreductase [Rhizodiscina lignyota]|uniref:Oxidoreductase n=1 Tax=Rhizodiscina lignyota TaxID=1504668 RepID=A0A9P4IRK0_9PEZI|nr:oxidoreductase [Rhizodiscina lignyota]
MVNSRDKLVGKKVIVVGGTSGIGNGAALALLEHGAEVVIVSSNEDRVNEVVKKINNPKLTGKVGNVRDEAQYTECLKSLAPCDHLIYSGVDKIIRGAIADGELEDWKWYFGVKFWGSALTGKIVSKYDIIKPGGSLTLTSGTGAMKPGMTASIGGSLNAGLFTMTTGLANELKEKKIRVNCVVPGMVQTELWDKLGVPKDKQKDNFEKAANNLPVGFVATPEDIAEAYIYVLRADYTNGTLITIDGGGVL